MRLPTDIEITSHRPVVGGLIVACKKLVGFLVGPYLRNVFEKERLITGERFNSLERRLDEGLRTMDKRLGEEIERLRLRREELAKTVRDLSQEMVLQKRRLELILEELRKKESLPEGKSIKRILDEGRHIRDHSYFVFENRFRGSREEIRKRQEVYLPVFNNTLNGFPVLDVGCGRGEFLELLKEKGISARGIDTNEEMVYACRERGLDAEQAEALSYMKGLEDGSLGGVFACQFIEHLAAGDLVEFVNLCHGKVESGGKVVFETINPGSVFAMRNFYLDLSHKTPIQPQAISFLMESAGFGDIEVKYLSPVPEDIKLNATGDRNIEKLNELLYGHQDYAVVGTK